MDLCLMIEGQEGVSWEQWLALAQACEAHGIATLFRSDHYQNLDGRDPGRAATDAWATLTALGAVTTTLRLGTLVSPASFRHPSVLAKMVATADHISGGRVELGLGAGWHEGEHAAYGFPYLPLGERLDVLEEQLAIVLGSWAPGPFDFDGAHYRLRANDARPKPVQRPHPPLIMGGNAGPRVAAMAARYADEYNTVFATPEQVAQRRARIAAACEQAGREMMPFSVMTGVLIGETEDEVRARARRLADKAGIDAIADPPPGWIVGTVDEAAQQLRALGGVGVDRVMCQQLLHDDLEAIALLGERLAPLVR